jgi:hypothetical protein
MSRIACRCACSRIETVEAGFSRETHLSLSLPSAVELRSTRNSADVF